jgi:hypothetical protein
VANGSGRFNLIQGDFDRTSAHRRDQAMAKLSGPVAENRDGRIA